MLLGLGRVMRGGRAGRGKVGGREKRSVGEGEGERGERGRDREKEREYITYVRERK